MIRFYYSVIILIIFWTGSRGQDEFSSSGICSTNDNMALIVNDTASATILAEAVNCSGGRFKATWRGSVFVEHTIIIPEGTTLNVTGEGSGAEINGGGEIRLFMSVGANLHINSLTLRNGNAMYGGAIYVDSSNVSFDGEMSLIGNTASYDGGALYIFGKSSVSWFGETSFVNNMANNNGGTMHINSKSTVSWVGNTSFVNNIAGNHGGALYLLNSTASWDGVTSFFNNTANCDAGALYISDESNVSWYGDTLFFENTASCDGGAWYIRESSYVSWYGETSFVNNMASDDGGAIRIQTGSIASWGGKTSFINNTAGDDGGAIIMYLDAVISWDGNTSFVNNTAGDLGGALYVLESNASWDGVTSFNENIAEFGGGLFVWDSNVFWDGVTSFVTNTAVEYGGALNGYSDSKISWDGETSFLGNRAQYGGALAVYDSSVEVTWTGLTSFAANEAISDGGAIYATIGCNISVEGNTNFINNVAAGDGGAVCVPFDRDYGNISYFTFENSRSVLFQGNTCEGNGGAIAFIGDVDAHFLLDMAFLKNSAGVAGGAIYLSGVTGEIQFEGTRFISNSAMTGGALSLVGESSLTGCTFAGNSAYENEGPAISNNGIITEISNCNFVDNAFNCEAGKYLEFNYTSSVQLDDSCTGCSIDCTNCTLDGKGPTCVEALEHTNAIGVGSTLQGLLINPGYWRATNTSVNILGCYNSKSCLGGLTREGDYCLEGYEGPYCSVCSEGYTSSFGFTCNKCNDNPAGGIALVVIMTVLVLFIFAVLVSYMISGKIRRADQGIVGRLTRLVPLHSVKIVIVVWQILTQFSTVANVVFPGVYQTFLDGVDILNFDLTWILSIGCMIDMDFHDQLLLATLGPLVCMVILGVTYVAAIRRNCLSEDGRGKVYQKHVSMVLLLTFLVYSSVSSTLFKTFACDNLDDGKNYLRADYRIECDSAKHNGLEVYAGLMAILYVIGIPVFYGVLLYNNREALAKKTEREKDESIKPITDLWKPYRPDRCYYEIVECVRRVLLTGALVFVFPNTAGQIAVALMIATFFIFVSEVLAPHSSSWDTWINRTGHAIVYTSMFLALLLKIDVTGEHTSSETAFESVLVAAHSCLVLVVVTQAVVMVMALRKEVKEYPIPRMRLGYSRSVGNGGVFLEDKAPPSYEDEEENEEKSHPKQVMGQSQTATNKNIDISSENEC